MSSSAELAAFPSDWVGKLALFRDLMPRELETVCALLERHEYPTDTILVEAGVPGETLYLVQSGALKVAVNEGERAMIVAILGPGALTGDMTMLDGGDRLQVTTQTPCVLATLSRFDFWNTVWAMPAVPFNLARIMSGRVRRQNAQIVAMGTLDVPSRMARQLALLTREHGVESEGGEIELPFRLTQAELAQMIGTSRVHVNQTLARWQEGRLVSFTRGKIVVRAPQTLYRLAEGR